MKNITQLFHAMMEISSKGNLTKGDLKLYVYLVGRCGNNNLAKTNLTQLSAELRELKGNVWVSLRNLHNKGIIEIKKGEHPKWTPMPLEINLNYAGFKFNAEECPKSTTVSCTQQPHPGFKEDVLNSKKSDIDTLSELKENEKNDFSDLDALFEFK